MRSRRPHPAESVARERRASGLRPHRGAAWLAAACLLALPAPSQGAPDAGEELAAFETLQERIIAVSERVKPIVVHIEAIVKVNNRRKHVEGSGFIIDASGKIVTNQHVVDKAQKVEVTIPGRTQKYPATVVGADKQTDVALLKIEPDGAPLAVAELGSVDALRVGQWVLAVGNPYGLDGTVSFGIVSAKGRNLEVDKILNDFIQTDAMIDRGSSGGPLVDLDGRVIGINSRGQGRGIGFTIPIDTALDVVEQLAAGGVERGWMGVTIQPLDRDLAGYFGIPDTTGVIVNSVSGRSPAAKAGLEPGDVVTHFNDVPIAAEKEEDLGTFQRQVAGIAPGEKADLRVLRGGEARDVEIVLSAQPAVVPNEEESDLGFHVEEITEITYRDQRLATREGAYVRFVERGSPASESGLKPGDVIARIGEDEVKDLEGFRSAIDATEEKEVVLITARRGDMVKYLLVKRGATPAEPGEPGEDQGAASHSE